MHFRAPMRRPAGGCIADLSDPVLCRTHNTCYAVCSVPVKGDEKPSMVRKSASSERCYQEFLRRWSHVGMEECTRVEASSSTKLSIAVDDSLVPQREKRRRRRDARRNRFLKCWDQSIIGGCCVGDGRYMNRSTEMSNGRQLDTALDLSWGICRW